MKTKFHNTFGEKYWDKLINFKYLADLGLISDEDLNLEYADTASKLGKLLNHQINIFIKETA